MTPVDNDTDRRKKQKRDVSSEDGAGSTLPSKEAVASKGLEAKVDMATHGQSTWALTDLARWRNASLCTENSAEFVKNKQREIQRALLRGGEAPGDDR